LIASVRAIYPQKQITGIFQPHLFSRTQDFGPEFAQALSKLDRLFLLPIYPARELPIPGVNSEWLAELCSIANVIVVQPHELLTLLREQQTGVLLTIGAGDIDRVVGPLTDLLNIQMMNR
jgi:UDP-N-acetylmuramate--alanine ligase